MTASALESSSPAITVASPLEGHLELGTRITAFGLSETKRTGAKGFLGRIRKLEENQNYLPIKFFAAWMFNANWGLELTWDTMELDTYNRAEDSYTTFIAGDGVFTANNYYLTFFGRYPNETIFTPYGGLGLAYLTGSFDEYDWWYYNYPDEAAYKAAGSPGQGNKSYIRDITVESAIGYQGMLGTDIYLNDNWAVDLSARFLVGQVDAEFRKERKGVLDSSDLGEFPLDSLTLGAGIRYAF